MLRATLLTFMLSVTAADITAQANTKYTTLSIVFEESAPKDIFTIQNTGQCSTHPMLLRIDMSTSKSGLIFDPTDGGAGVQVFQPLEIRSGRNLIASVSEVRDGDNDVTFMLKSLKPDTVVSFTIDVDDTLPQSERGQTMISASEMQGATVEVKSDGKKALKSVFTDRSVARIKNIPCL